MKYEELMEKLKPSQYRELVKGWDKERYKEIFTDSKYEHDRNGYRVYIPIDKPNAKVDVPREIEVALDYEGYEVEDYIKGIAISHDKKRRMKIGKILKNHENALHWFTVDPTRAAYKENHLCVISRHPYDIAGMSTDRGWYSCMNLGGGSYSRFVPLDIEHGTVIAYAIKEDDRNIENPVCRVLMKPFINDDKKDLIYFGIENTVYGTEVPGFVNTVRAWVDEINDKNELGEVILVHAHPDLYIDSMPREERYRALGGNEIEQEQIKTVIERPSELQYIDYPSEVVQLAAVKIDGMAISYIKNPSEKVQMEAIKKSPSAVYFIKNPTENVQIAAVKLHGSVIRHMKNPSETVQMAAVKSDGYVLHYLDNPSYEVQKEAVKYSPFVIDAIENPSEELQILAVEKNANVISKIKNPTEAVQRLALEIQPMAIIDIEDPLRRIDPLCHRNVISRRRDNYYEVHQESI